MNIIEKTLWMVSKRKGKKGKKQLQPWRETILQEEEEKGQSIYHKSEEATRKTIWAKDVERKIVLYMKRE